MNNENVPLHMQTSLTVFNSFLYALGSSYVHNWSLYNYFLQYLMEICYCININFAWPACVNIQTDLLICSLNFSSIKLCHLGEFTRWRWWFGIPEDKLHFFRYELQKLYAHHTDNNTHPKCQLGDWLRVHQSIPDDAVGSNCQQVIEWLFSHYLKWISSKSIFFVYSKLCSKSVDIPLQNYAISSI